MVQKLARVALKDDALAVLDNEVRAGDYHKRIGSLHGIGVSRAPFTHVFSVRQTRDDHINRLEGKALLLMLRWILRSSMRHASRVVILLDSAVLLGGAAKGRSSSRLNTILRRAAALQLLGDLWCIGFWCHRPRILATFRQEDNQRDKHIFISFFLATGLGVHWNEKSWGCALSSKKFTIY